MGDTFKGQGPREPARRNCSPMELDIRKEIALGIRPKGDCPKVGHQAMVVATGEILWVLMVSYEDGRVWLGPSVETPENITHTLNVGEVHWHESADAWR